MSTPKKSISATKWASCCGRLFSGDLTRAHWTHCLSCKKPLTYGDSIPGERLAAPAKLSPQAVAAGAAIAWSASQSAAWTTV